MPECLKEVLPIQGGKTRCNDLLLVRGIPYAQWKIVAHMAWVGGVDIKFVPLQCYAEVIFAAWSKLS